VLGRGGTGKTRFAEDISKRSARESFERELLRWIWASDKSERPEVRARLGGLPPTVDVRVMR
jgi:hypothetical protein